MQSVTDFSNLTPASIEMTYHALLETPYHRFIERAMLESLEYRRKQWSPEQGKVLWLSFARIRGQAVVLLTRLQWAEEQAAKQPQAVGGGQVVTFPKPEEEQFNLRELDALLGYQAGPSPANFRGLVMHICTDKLTPNGFTCTNEIREVQCRAGRSDAFPRQDRYLKITWD